MQSTSYLLFSVHEARYGVRADSVREIWSLPQLTIWPHSSPALAGLVDVRGHIMPVWNTALLLGHAPRAPTTHALQLSDSVIVIELAEEPLDESAGAEPNIAGLIVQSLHIVRDITPSQIETMPPALAAGTLDSREAATGTATHGVAHLEDGLVILLDATTLLRQVAATLPPAQSTLSGALATTGGTLEMETTAPGFFNDATPEERAILRERADRLRQAPQNEDFSDLLGLAVFQLSGELFGIDLGLVREFGTVDHCTPVPCCPPHIMGQINLRGDIVTLVDIRPSLGLQTTGDDAPRTAPGKTETPQPVRQMVVVQNEEWHLGVPVERVLGVLHLHPSQVRGVPLESDSGRNFLRGTAPYGDTTLGLLDLAAVLEREEMIVDDSV